MTNHKPPRRFGNWVRGFYPSGVPTAPVFNSSTHIPALDGLRGIAILLVLVLHFTIYGGLQPTRAVDSIYYVLASAGWCGVDLFFVLSGFLITGILFDTRESTHYFRNFYVRRVLRIFPLYYGSLFVAFVVLPGLMAASSDVQDLTADARWYWAYGSNILIALHGWPKSELSNFALGHFWSLAVEEQFYLLWPPLVFLFRRSNLPRLCLLVIIGGFVSRAAIVLTGNTTAGYVLMPARMDTLALGAWIAVTVRTEGALLVLRRWTGPFITGCGVALASLMLWQGGLESENSIVQILGFPLLACLFAAMLVVALPVGLEGDHGILNTATLRFLGRYSYGIYVFHHPMVLLLRRLGLSASSLPSVFGTQLLGQLGFLIVGGLASVGAAFVSWHLYESQFLRLKKLFAYQYGLNDVRVPPSAGNHALLT